MGDVLKGGIGASSLKECAERGCEEHQWAKLWDGKVLVLSDRCQEHTDPPSPDASSEWAR
jgi:hypothetical protein